MKRILLVLTILILTGCGRPYHFESASMNIDASGSASVGDVFFRYESMHGEKDVNGFVWYGGAKAFELIVVSLTDSTLALLYNEYTKGSPNGFAIKEPWSTRDAFNQKYDYNLPTKTIRFRTYEFEVLANDDGSLQYRRIH